MKKKFSYEYDLATVGIIKSLIGKSNVNSRDIQKLFDVLVLKERKAYNTHSRRLGNANKQR